MTQKCVFYWSETLIVNFHFEIANTYVNVLSIAAAVIMIQWNLSITTTFIIKFITCDLFSNVF